MRTSTDCIIYTTLTFYVTEVQTVSSLNICHSNGNMLSIHAFYPIIVRDKMMLILVKGGVQGKSCDIYQNKNTMLLYSDAESHSTDRDASQSVKLK